MQRPTTRPDATGATLCDLLPALCWADPCQLGPVLDDPRLPQQWWSSVPLNDVMATIGAGAVARRAAAALRAFWPHLALDLAMPALRFCTEGQQTDLDQSIGQAADESTAGEEEEGLAPLIRALLRPFQEGGRDLAAAELPVDVDTASTELSVLAEALLRRLPTDTPAEVRLAAESVAAWAKEDLAVTGTHEPPVSSEPREGTTVPALSAATLRFLDGPLEVFNALAMTWDERQTTIAAKRVFAIDKIALEALGEQFGVTRERIRQIQIHVEKQFLQWLSSDQGRLFQGHMLAVEDLLGPVAAEHELQQCHPDHQATVPTLGLPLWQILAGSLPHREWTDGWLVDGDLTERQEETRSALTQRCSESALPWAEAVELLAALDIREEVAEQWLTDLTGFHLLDGHLLPWGRAVNDRAEAVFMLVGHPMSAADLLAKLSDGTALLSLRNQLQADDRFMRRDRDLYGLRSWGGTEYLGIREMITRELEERGGEARSEDIVSSLCAQFEVSDKSVRAYLGGAGFDRFKRGWVRLASTTDADGADYQPRRDVAQTRRCFQTGQGTWWYRVDITREHLRGSGFPVPSGFAAHLGLTPGGKIELLHQVGEAIATWGNQPTFGSLRPLLEEMGVAEGDHVFLAAKEGHLKALRIEQEPEGDTDDTRRALRLMALSGRVSVADMPTVLGRRIGLADATTMDEVHAHLRLRGDKDILALLSGDDETDDPEASDSERPNEDAATPPEIAEAELQRDPAWDEEVIPLLDTEAEADLMALAEALAARGKRAPVFGYELGEAGWQVDFAWDSQDVRIAVVSAAQESTRTVGETEQRDAAYRAEGWTISSATEWLQRVDELAAALPDTEPPQ